VKSSVTARGEAEATARALGEGGGSWISECSYRGWSWGLLAGWLAGFVMKGGSYGLIGDLFLGMVGSAVGGWIFRALSVSAGGGLFPTVFVAFVGAVIVIVAQRKLWHTTRLAT
jgi:uncharacterized membrane protein YeaQ/YmgE (transglycosylase-associated protein family)